MTTEDTLRRWPPPEEIEAMLDSSGPFERHGYPGFSHRPGQKEMLVATTKAFENSPGVHLSVEGGTGIGKSLAYLIPAVLYAAKTSTTVVVTTNTINLQDQLVQNDIPQVVKVLELEGILIQGKLSHCALKGESNYLCQHRWENAVLNGTDAHSMLMDTVAGWTTKTKTGDLAELHLSHSQRTMWEKVSARRPQSCPYYRQRPDTCFMSQAKRAAKTAHVLVVNHALYLSTIKRGSGAIPIHNVVIIDEAHRLADEASKQLGAETASYELEKICQEIKDVTQWPKHPAASMALNHWDLTWDGLRRLIKSTGETSEVGVTLNLNECPYPEWRMIINDWNEFAAISLMDLARTLRANSKEQRQLMDVEMEETISRLMDLVVELKRKGDLFFSDTDDHVRVARDNGTYEIIRATPLEVATELKELIFNERKSAVLTSATLAPGGNFLPTQRELGIAPDQPTAVCQSPFHYQEQAMLLSPKDIPNPSQDSKSHETAVQETLIAIAKSLGGRTLALFTSRSALFRCANVIEPSLQSAGIELIVQGRDGPASTVARRMSENPHSLAMGVDAMWEGIDLPPTALCAVAICRLPFPVPSDPVIKARGKLYLDSFHEYYLPQAVRRFRQGCGRLIRSAESRGVIVILDPRIRHPKYGEIFWKALPNMSMARSVLSDVALLAAEFVERPTTQGE